MQVVALKDSFTKEEVRVVKASIKHWKRDIQDKLKKGCEIYSSRPLYLLRWEDNRECVKCYSDNCPLCSVSFMEGTANTDCTVCPYYKRYGQPCTSYHWDSFIRRPNLETCNAMIKALEDILK